MILNEIRIYSEVFEQGLYFLEHIEEIIEEEIPIQIIMINKSRTYIDTSLIALLRNQKKFDLLIAVIINDNGQQREIPILFVEYSTAVQTDDHEWQRFDGLFWAIYYQIPYLKISSEGRVSQTAGTEFGGGSNLSIEDEQYLIRQNNGVMHHIHWESLGSSQYLRTHEQYYSCPPHQESLENLLNSIFNTLYDADSIPNFYNTYFQNNSNLVMPTTYNDIFPPANSERLNWNPTANEFKLKVNRFGHAMDPERGGLAFFKLISDSLENHFNVIAEFQIQRDVLRGRKSYKALFDGVGRERELLQLATQIFNSGNLIDADNAIRIFKMATNTERLFNNSQRNLISIILNDTSLSEFLHQSLNSTIKNILLYANSIILTDLDRNEIVRIEWNHQIVETYFRNKKNRIFTQLIPLPLRSLEYRDMKEDLITYSCIRLLRNCGLRILAVSYPDAQGERCILIGEGRQTQRKFIDIIAISERDIDYDVLLQENKEDLNNSGIRSDLEKLIDIRDNNIQCLRILIDNLIGEGRDLTNVYIGIGGKNREDIQHANIDYIIMITLENILHQAQRINWTIGIVNMELLPIFHNLENINTKTRRRILLQNSHDAANL